MCALTTAIVAIGADNSGPDMAPHWLRLQSLADRPVHWLGELVLGDHLYVRSCYRRLYAIVKEIWAKSRWALLLGSPGQCTCMQFSQAMFLSNS